MNTKSGRAPAPTTVGLALSSALKQAEGEKPETGEPEVTQQVQPVVAQVATPDPADTDTFNPNGEGDDNESDEALNLLESDDDDDGDDNGIVEIYSADCLTCKALVPFAEKARKKCHFSRGNEHCPAQSLQIQIRLPIDEIVARFLRAEAMGDNQRLARLYAKLGTKSEYAQKRINDALREARLARSNG